ncbi:hypothetical protein [Pseudonocardia sp. NPDC049635]|uniref:hypothetical protein n=1 Tax=Pseudonocardia sp. NPDC049635 TaxID=3155506 RepID=UPI0033C6C75D
MGIGRYVLAVVLAGALATAACSAASGADRVALDPAAPSTIGQSAPAAGLLPRVDAGSSELRAAVIEAIATTRVRVAAAEKKAAEERARTREEASRGEGPQSAEEAEATSDGGCAQRAMTAGQFDPLCDEYQGYLDPGAAAGRAPTSGETQMQYACEQGLVPESDC